MVEIPFVVPGNANAHKWHYSQLPSVDAVVAQSGIEGRNTKRWIAIQTLPIIRTMGLFDIGK